MGGGGEKLRHMFRYGCFFGFFNLFSKKWENGFDLLVLSGVKWGISPLRLTPPGSDISSPARLTAR